ncbi:hypothetical protein [Chengkuizengella sediminis]|uniref:hypothetical protein n=1 Tax=Chengkuizengella sediminis TaxID=1885917 RepID=UPI001389F39F|nr:hypothetical protein [Chengkuizengella sediminis]NDI33614.1 hypothetical protein [Chengkuizengella sediminis]
MIQLDALNTPTVILSVDVYVKQPQRTQVSLDSMAQIAVDGNNTGATTFEETYEILRNDVVIATINDLMDYEGANFGRHTNFPNFPLVDDNPSARINKYELRVTRVAPDTGVIFIFVASRSLKATVFTA